MDPQFLAPLIPIVAIIAFAAVKITRIRATRPESPSTDVTARLEALEHAFEGLQQESVVPRIGDYSKRFSGLGVFPVHRSKNPRCSSVRPFTKRSLWHRTMSGTSRVDRSGPPVPAASDARTLFPHHLSAHPTPLGCQCCRVLGSLGRSLVVADGPGSSGAGRHYHLYVSLSPPEHHVQRAHPARSCTPAPRGEGVGSRQPGARCTARGRLPVGAAGSHEALRWLHSIRPLPSSTVRRPRNTDSSRTRSSSKGCGPES